LLRVLKLLCNHSHREDFLTMPRKRTLKLRCPICKKTVRSGDPEFPFCSDRCRTIDLGKWASGEYVIPSPVNDEDEQLRESLPEDVDEES
jgi:endogenous inhibitor of DNA gyrase (YacG/DUF329 family)